ncbi:Uncharacterized protein TCM_006956 [Theobroma cacao]|uniref:Uncharacterized protein n=1 Tax=Theobroma cacao TaxID=3641 RepID=A0A061E0G8_THECC|nr:Uncharacterized protein TCM_006956 [Theobroma cacao]
MKGRDQFLPSFGWSFVCLKGLRPIDENPDQARERFSKRLTQNEVDKCLLMFPFTAVVGLFAFEIHRLFCLDVVGRSGKAWTFLASFEPDEDMVSVFSIRCPQFASEYALKANDEVTFVRQALNDNDKAPWMKFKIEIRRKIILFGQDIWGEVMV